jgi:hypothetical protein
MRIAASSFVLLSLTALAGCAAPGDGSAGVAAPALTIGKAGDTFSGTLYAVQTVGAGRIASTRYFLADASGKSRPVTLTAKLAAQLGVGDRGLVTGIKLSGALVKGAIVVDAILVNGTVISAPHAVLGHKRYATLLCRFADLPFPAPEDGLYFEQLFGAQAPGLRHYFSTASYGALDFDADPFSVVAADFPDSLANYVDADSGVVNDLTGLLTKCAEIANGNVYLPDYDGVVFAFSHNLNTGDGQFNFAGDLELGNDNISKVYRFGALSPTAFRSHQLTAQTMGLALGLLRTGTSASDLDSDWDLMSHGGRCSQPDPVFGCVAVLPAMPLRQLASWLPAGKLYTLSTGYSEVTLDRADVVPAAGRYAMARVALPGTPGSYYSFEYRAPSSTGSYDEETPESGVVVHQYQGNPSGLFAGSLVDRNHDGDPNDAGSAQPVNGELWDATNKIDVRVLGANGTGIKLGISTQTATLTISPKPSSGMINGTGIHCGFPNGNDCSQSYDVGTIVQLTATGSDNYRIDQWSGCWSHTSGNCNVNMRRPATVSATFAYHEPEDPPICKTKPDLPQCHAQQP